MYKKHHFCSERVESEKIADKEKVHHRSFIFCKELTQVLFIFKAFDLWNGAIRHYNHDSLMQVSCLVRTWFFIRV